jgi:hypothetical protein
MSDLAPLKTRILAYFLPRCPARRARAASFLDHEIDWCEYRTTGLRRGATAFTPE